MSVLLETRGQEESELLLRYHRYGDQGARDELVARMLPTVRKLARRYQRGSEQLDDLVQVGSLGLVKAIERFDPERGSPFMRYAVPTILGEIKRHFRDHGWAAHVPRGLQERVMEVRAAVDTLSTESGRSPSPSDVAVYLDMSSEEVVEALEASTAYSSASLDAPRDSDDGERESYGESLGAEDGRYALVDETVSVAPELAALSERERTILHLRFVEDLTQSEIGARVGVSQMHVSRLLRGALERLRTATATE